MPAPLGSNHNPKGHPATLTPGGAFGQGRKLWGGPTEEWWEEFLGRVASGENATRIVKAELDANYDTFLAWMRREGLYEQFHEAISARIDGMVFEIIEIADDQEGDTYIDQHGNEQTNTNVIQRAKLRVDTRKFVMQSMDARFKPKQDINVTGLTDEELRAQLKSEIAAFTGRSEAEGDQPSGSSE